MDNYAIAAAQAKKRFLTYDQQELIGRCRLRFDDEYFYFRFLGEQHRLCRKSGDLSRMHGGSWVDANSFGEVMTVLDWLCDSRADRYITGRWVNVVTQSHSIHTGLQEDREDPDALLFDRDPGAFAKVCEALGGVRVTGGDISYAIELVDGLKICIQLWRGDEEFSPRLRFLWDENALRYIRYETTWYATGLLLRRLKENM